MPLIHPIHHNTMSDYGFNNCFCRTLLELLLEPVNHSNVHTVGL